MWAIHLHRGASIGHLADRFTPSGLAITERGRSPLSEQDRRARVLKDSGDGGLYVRSTFSAAQTHGNIGVFFKMSADLCSLSADLCRGGFSGFVIWEGSTAYYVRLAC
jgi:hypothetical protein